MTCGTHHSSSVAKAISTNEVETNAPDRQSVLTKQRNQHGGTKCVNHRFPLVTALLPKRHRVACKACSKCVLLRLSHPVFCYCAYREWRGLAVGPLRQTVRFPRSPNKAGIRPIVVYGRPPNYDSAKLIHRRIYWSRHCDKDSLLSPQRVVVHLSGASRHLSTSV